MKITFTGYRQTATLATLAFVTTLAGCTMTPKHERPTSPTAVVYPYATSTVSGAPDAADIGWRDFFHDPLLQELIAIALRNNRDLRKAGLMQQLNIINLYKALGGGWREYSEKKQG